jgi:hypothetical protein
MVFSWYKTADFLKLTFSMVHTSSQTGPNTFVFGFLANTFPSNLLDPPISFTEKDDFNITTYFD